MWYLDLQYSSGESQRIALHGIDEPVLIGNRDRLVQFGILVAGNVPILEQPSLPDGGDKGHRESAGA
jgi:hypothetical protein